MSITESDVLQRGQQPPGSREVEPDGKTSWLGAKRQLEVSRALEQMFLSVPWTHEIHSENQCSETDRCDSQNVKSTDAMVSTMLKVVLDVLHPQYHQQECFQVDTRGSLRFWRVCFFPGNTGLIRGSRIYKPGRPPPPAPNPCVALAR